LGDFALVADASVLGAACASNHARKIKRFAQKSAIDLNINGETIFES
jgi:hypothetical protein